MKVHIIYLDPQDDHVSARDKLGWIQAPHVALVWPDRGRVLTRQLDLILLQRYARQRGSQIGFVTHDPDVIHHATQLGIPVFDSLDNLSQQSWHPPSRRRKRQPIGPSTKRDPWRLESLAERQPATTATQPRPGIRWAIFALAIASVVALAATIGPSATIVLQPETQLQQMQLTITLDPDAISSTSQGRIPALQIRMRILGDSQQPTSGTVAVPSTRAVGTVVFTNLTSEPITIPAGTGVRTTTEPAHRFTTTQTAQLPGTVGATSSASVQAVQLGSSGNLEAGSLRAIDGLLGLRASVNNPEPMHGGQDESMAAVSEADQQHLEQVLTDELIERAANDRQESLDEGEILAVSCIAVSRVYSRHFDHQVGDAADTLSLTLDLELLGLVYHQSDLERAAELALQAEASGDREPVPGSLQIDPLTIAMPTQDDLSTFPVKLTQETYEPIDLTPLSRKILGLAPEDAAFLVEDQFGLTVVSIKVWPRWWPWLPWLPPRLSAVWSWEAK